MTSVPGHGMALSYYNKAMDLHSLVIDVNEEILATSEEKRAHVIELQQKFLKDIDVALKRHSQVSFCRATVHFFPKASLLRGSTKTPVGQALFFPLKIQGDALTCTLFTAGIEPLDHRRIIPTMEKIQSQLDEVRRVTLVRGINFVQQDAILQRHANRLMQHAEADYCEARWHQAKQPVMKSPAKMAIDVQPVPERPEWLKVATYHMPWHIDATNGQFIPRVDETTQEIEALEAAIEDEYLIQFHIVCPAIPIVPRLLETACTHLDKLWTELIPSFVPRWKHDLVQALIGRVVASMKTEEYSIKTTPGIMERDVLDLVIGLMKGYDEYASGLEGKFRDLKSQPVDANIFNAMLEGFKTVVGKSASIDLLADAIKTAHAASLASTISPGMESDPRVAEGTLLQVKLGIHGLKTTLVQSTVEALKQAMLGQVATKLDDLLIKKALQNEKGIVKEIGISIVKEASKTFFRRHVEQLAGEGGAGTPVLDPATYQADYKEALHSYLATFKIDIGQLIQLAAELLDQDQQDTIAPYMQKFIALKRDVVFLKEFVLKSNVLNKFLEKHYEHFYDPKSFGKLLGDWVSAEVAQLPVEWGSLLGNWFAAFTNVFQIQHAQKALTRSEIVTKFYEFTKIVADEQNTFENTFAIMSAFVGTLADSKDKKALTEYLKRFEQSQAFTERFPGYLEGKIGKVLAEIKPIDLEVTIDDKPTLAAAIARRVEAGAPGLHADTIPIPSEIVFQFDKDPKIEYKLALEAASDGLSVTLLTNWFKLVDAY